MKSIIVIFLISCTAVGYSQNQGIELPDSVAGCFIYNMPDKDRIIKKLNDCLKYSPEVLTRTSKWSYHMRISSSRH